MEEQKTWGKREIEDILDQLEERGENGDKDAYQWRRQIKQSIREQDPKLVSSEITMINTALMLFIYGAGYLARGYVTRLLAKHFD